MTVTPEPNEEEIAAATHPGFTITCNKCDSKFVIVDSSVGYSEISGSWGSVDLECQNCHESVTLWEPY